MTCNAPFVPVGSICGCSVLTQFVNVAQTGCASCGSVITDCNLCLNTLPTTCQACATGFSPSASGLTCVSCPLNCNICSSETVCTICNTGYGPWNGVSCTCDSICQNCLSITSGACSACSDAVTCSGCAAGWYLVAPTCLTCDSTCLACSGAGPSSCISCSLPFTLDSATKQCLCDNAAGDYLTLDSTTCLPCGNIITNCISCLATPSTICTACTPGHYVNPSDTTQCLPCTYPCTTCTGSATACDSCYSTWTLNNPGNTCYCDDTNQMFYSAVYDACVSCGMLLDNCLSCSINGSDPTITNCNACADPYYADPVTFTCLMCDPRCTACTALDTCSTCATNLLPNGTFCNCDTGTDPTLSYYSVTNLCISCVNLLTNCLTCNPDPLECTACIDGSYVDNLVCVNCPS
jgi:proprotein convertase subtilisin/kexin type 5